MVETFVIENHLYDETFIYKGKDLLKVINERLEQILAQGIASESTSHRFELNKATL